MDVKIDLDISKIKEKVTSDRFGTFVAEEWKRLIDPYTPRDTGLLEENVNILPFKLHYKQKYAKRQYYGKDFNYQKKNPYSASEWDRVAEQAGQKNKLYREINSALRNGSIK